MDAIKKDCSAIPIKNLILLLLNSAMVGHYLLTNREHHISWKSLYINRWMCLSFFSAIRKDGVKVKGYFAWSLMDNFEWTRGYSDKFGLHQVNFSDPARPRVPKKSAHWYRDLIQVNGWKQSATTPQPQSQTTSGSIQSALNRITLSPFLIIVASYLW